jgi:hypothetical protein
LLLKAQEARKKVSWNSTFHVGSGKNVWVRILDEKMVGSRSGIKHPGSAILPEREQIYDVIAKDLAKKIKQ